MPSGEERELAPLPVGGAARPLRPVAPTEPPVRRWPSRPVVVFVTGAVLGALAASLAVVHVARGPAPGPRVGGPAAEGEAAGSWSWPGGATGPGDEAPPPGWRRGMPGPLRPRDGHATVWTGSELIVWGGDPEGDGAAYDPRRDRWRQLEPAPIPPPYSSASAWSGSELLVWGGRRVGVGPVGTGLAYRPAADRWRFLPPAPLSPRTPLAGVWTGREFVIVGGTPDFRTFLTDGAAYDPAADRWRAVPPLPFPLDGGVGLWTGRDVLVVGEQVAAWEPGADAWRVLPAPPLAADGLTAVWTGREVVAWDYELHSAALDPYGGEETWRALTDLPLRITDCRPEGVMAGRVVFAEHCGQGAVFRPSTREWSEVPHPRQLAAVPRWTGRELIFWVGSFVGSADGVWRFRPPGPRPVGPVPPLHVPTGRR